MGCPSDEELKELKRQLAERNEQHAQRRQRRQSQYMVQCIIICNSTNKRCTRKSVVSVWNYARRNFKACYHHRRIEKENNFPLKTIYDTDIDDSDLMWDGAEEAVIFSRIMRKEITLCETCDTFFKYVPQRRFCDACQEYKRKREEE